MKLSDFDYILPKELIAQYPLKERDDARLLVLNRKEETIEHRIFKDIRDYLIKDDLLTLNDTKVLPSRLIGSRATGGKREYFTDSHRNINQESKGRHSSECRTGAVGRCV